MVQIDPQPDTPVFIVEVMERDHGGFRDFNDDDSRGHVLGAAFLLGAAFVQNHDALSWALGADDVANVNQPVVAGFRMGAHLPVLSVAENLLMDFDEQRVRSAVATWSGVV